MRRNKKKWMQTVAWLCCASLVSGAVIPNGSLAAGLNGAYANALEKAAREANIQEVTVEEEKTINNSADTVVDLSEHVGMYTKDVTDMEWSVDFKTTDTAIQSLMTIGNSTAHEYNYMTLYVANNKIGFEFRDTAANFSKSATLSQTVADGNYHNLKLVVKTNSKFELYYDGNLIQSWDSGFVFLNNASYMPDYFTVGGMKRNGHGTNDAKNWYFNGTVKNIYARTITPGEESEIPEEGNLIYKNERITMNTASDSVNATEYLDALKGLEKGTITVRYRAKDASQGLSALFSLSSTQEGRDNSYAVAYVNPASGTVGVEVRDTVDGKTINYNQSSKAAAIQDDYWHTITYVFGKSTFTIYVDGEAVLQNDKTGFFSKVSDPTTVKIGAMDRIGKTNQWGFSGYIDQVQVWDTALNQEVIVSQHEATKKQEVSTETPEGVIKTEDTALFYQGYDNSISYRIPSLLTTSKGTVIAGIDKRQSGAADTGNIDAVIRRSLDGGKTWQNPQTLIDLPPGGDRYAFTIDASMVEDKETGRLFFIVDMFPESTALMAGDTINEVSSAYKEIDGERYYILKDAQNNEYTIREEGKVYDNNGKLTDYTVPKLTSGILYQAGKPCGNIFLRTGENAGKLRALKTSYLWMVYSDDDGATWSEPTDITKGIKKDWQSFFGTGPGVGIQMENGRLVVPVYYTNSVIGNSQSSAVIYSDDHGETWKCGESPNDGRNYNGEKLNTETLHNTGAMLTESQVVEVKDRDGKAVLKLFCRSLQGHVMIATSYDGGETWEDDLQQDAALRDPYCQMTIVPYPYEVKGLEGKQLFIFANPNAGNRSNGTVRLGYYDPETDQFVWPYSQVVYAGDYAYSCLSVMGENKIGLFYEATVPNMMFTTFNTEWIQKGSSQTVEEASPEIKSITRDGNTVVIESSQPIFVMGDMTLKAVINETEQKLAYVSGSGTTTLVFALPENTPADAVIVYDAMDDVQLLDKYYGNAHNKTFAASGVEDLNKLIKQAEALNESDYSDGWDTLQQQLAAAKAVINKLNPTDAEITKVKTDLQAAIDALIVASVDKSALQAAFDSYKGKNEADYSQKSWSRFQAAMTNAETVLKATNSTQSQVDEAREELTDAANALGVDKSKLWSAIVKYSKYTEQQYEQDGWDAFTAALENAKTTANTESLKQPQIDAALKQLTDAASALRELPKVDKTALRSLMHECGSYEEENYEAETWSVLQNALQGAKNVSKDTTASQQTVDAALNTLQKAVSELKVIAGNIGGIVTDENGTPIEGVTISVGTLTTKTAKDGTYLLQGVPIATSDVTADDDQYIAVTESVTVTEADSGVNKVVHDFILKEASTTIRGDVTAVGVLMAGLTVTIQSGDFEQSVVTDENGQYCFENVPTKDYVIQTEAEGYEALSKEIKAVKQNDVIVPLMLLPKTQEGVADYENNYDDGKVYWDNLAGTTNMTITNENGATKLVFPGGGHANAYETGAPTFKNGCVEMDITTVEQNGVRIGILLRAKDMNNRVYVGVGDSENQYFSEYWGSSGNSWSNMANGEAFQAGKKMHLKAEIIDNTVTLWVNGVQVLSNTMANMPLEAGAVGLNCRAAKEVIVDNIKVTSYDEPTGEVENIAGHVSNEAAAVVGAEVTLSKDGTIMKKTTTDTLGNYKFKNIPYGTYTVSASYGESSKSVEVVVEKSNGYCVVPEIQLDQQQAADKSELELVINAFAAYDKDDYTEESFAPFEEALESAQIVFDDEAATQEQVNRAIEALQTAASGLVKKPDVVDKSALQAAIAIYDSYKRENYTEETFEPFAEALKAAKQVAADENATKETVDAALEALNQAAESLEKVPAVNKTKLDTVVSIYCTYEAEDYTEESFAIFAEALAKAEAVLNNEAATQEEVDTAFEVLQTAAKALEKAKPPVTVNKSSLQATITVCEQYKKDDYSEESFAVLQTALEEAKRVMTDETAAQKDVDAAIDGLLSAVKQLEEAPAEVNRTGLQAAITIYSTYAKDDYTEESFAAFANTLEDSKAILSKETVTQEEIDLALQALNQAAAALEKKPTQEQGVLKVSYSTHVQNIGWQSYVTDGALAGTSGKGLRLEGIKIRLDNNAIGGSVEYRTHVQNVGWQSYVADGALAGTSGKGLRLEAIQVRLTGKIAEKYDIYYRTHVQDLGWLGWAINDAKAGTSGLNKRLEAIQIVLVEKGNGNDIPGTVGDSYRTNQKTVKPSVIYTTHVQNIGWQPEVVNGAMAGTSGKGLRLEGIKIRVNGDGLKGSVEYSTHVQNIGWQPYVSNGELSGTKGKGLRLEGIKIRLTGELAKTYSIEYRTHVQNEGWQAWVKDDAMSGTKGKSLRLEGIQIRLVKK